MAAISDSAGTATGGIEIHRYISDAATACERIHGRAKQARQRKVLRVIADLTQKSSFEKAIKTVSTALSYGAADVDSLINLHRYLYEKVLQLEPIHLPEHIPHLNRYVPDFMAYDRSLKAGEEKC